MNKFAILATGVTAVTGAAAYYVSPAGQSDIDVPPAVSDLSPAETMAELKTLSVASFARQLDREQIEGSITGSMKIVGEDEARLDIAVMQDKIVTLTFKVRPTGTGRTEVDIQPSIPESPVARSGELHPYDLKAIGGLADLLATEYVSSVLNRQRMASGDEMEVQMRRYVGFSDDQARAFGERVEAAFKVAYGDRPAGWGRTGWARASWGKGFRGDPYDSGFGRPNAYRYNGSEAGPGYSDGEWARAARRQAQEAEWVVQREQSAARAAERAAARATAQAAAVAAGQ